MKDSQQGKVYRAEHILQFMLDNARDNPMVTIEGITLTLPPEAKFSTVEDVRRYVDRVTRMPSVVAAFGEASIAVRPRKGTTKAHYQRNTQTIAIPEIGSRWALRELVVLHEIAHHYSRHTLPAHGPQFVGTLITLLELVMGPEAALLARILYAQNGAKAA